LSDIDLERDNLHGHLCRLMRAACDDPHAGAQLADLGNQIEGRTDHLYFGFQDHPIAVVSDGQDLVGMETTVLHEAGHWLEGHEIDREYEAAYAYDRANEAATRGPWEQAADRRGLDLLLLDQVRNELKSDPLLIEAGLIADARRYGEFEPGNPGECCQRNHGERAP
jgi:hypothetical protein